MVFEVETTTTEEQSTTTSTSGESLTTIEALERVSKLLQPFVQLITVIVQALTAYTLVRQL